MKNRKIITILAAGLTLPGDETINYPAGYDFARLSSLGGIITRLNTFVFPLAGIALLVYLILAGFQYMTSRGEPKALNAAKSKLTSALIGFVIIFIAFWIVQAVGIMLGIPSIITTFGGTGGSPPGGGSGGGPI